jgi:hypothetical protein
VHAELKLAAAVAMPALPVLLLLLLQNKHWACYQVEVQKRLWIMLLQLCNMITSLHCCSLGHLHV